MIKLTIDGQEIEAEEGLSLLEVAQKRSIKIPTLCNHPAVKPYGACRLCIVEVITKANQKRLSKVVTSCTYPVQEGIEVRTNSEKIKKYRKILVEMLLARCPEVKIIQELAKEMGVEKTILPLQNEDCVLCGLCVRVCGEVIGVEAIGFINRGSKRKVATPFEISSDACIGCGACAFVCPTGVIKIKDFEDKRKIDRWHTELKRAQCEKCGQYFFPQLEIDYVYRKGIKALQDILKLCPKCRRKALAEVWLNIYR